jgi:hypothetical protein
MYDVLYLFLIEIKKYMINIDQIPVYKGLGIFSWWFDRSIFSICH